MRCRSTRATLAPKPAAPMAVIRPAVPAPITTRLYRPSGWGLTQSAGQTLAARARSKSSTAIESRLSVTIGSLWRSLSMQEFFCEESHNKREKAQQRERDQDPPREDAARSLGG